MSDKLALRMRDHKGHFVSTRCPRSNCDGVLRPERDGWWRCDGLTYEEPEGPLYACPEVFHPEYGA